MGARFAGTILVLATSTVAKAQCVGNLPAELEGLTRFAIALEAPMSAESTATATNVSPADGAAPVRTGAARSDPASVDPGKADSATTVAGAALAPKAPPPPARLSRALIEARLHDVELFSRHVVRGNAGWNCIRDELETYRKATLSVLAKGDSVSTEDLRTAAARGAAAVLGPRYQATDRFSFVFGVGVGFVFQDNDKWQFRLAKMSFPGATANAPMTDTTFIVRESKSGTIPHASTGLMIRFRERQYRSAGTPHREWWNVLEFVTPAAIFTSLTLGSSDGAPVTGTVVGLGWSIAGASLLTIGYSAQRGKALREDLLKDWLADGDGRLATVGDETENSISGAQIINALVISVTMPIAFRGALGGR